MIIGFGFGDPITSLLMLGITSILSYWIFKAIRHSKEQNMNIEDKKEHLRAYYRNQRDYARDLMREYDLTDEEIERRIEEEIRNK